MYFIFRKYNILVVRRFRLKGKHVKIFISTGLQNLCFSNFDFRRERSHVSHPIDLTLKWFLLSAISFSLEQTKSQFHLKRSVVSVPLCRLFCSMLKVFFSLKFHLSGNNASITKNCFFAKRSNLRENPQPSNSVRHDNFIMSITSCCSNNQTLTTISHTQHEISLLNLKYRNIPTQPTKQCARGRPAPQTVGKMMCSGEVENSRQSNYPAVAIKTSEREKTARAAVMLPCCHVTAAPADMTRRVSPGRQCGRHWQPAYGVPEFGVRVPANALCQLRRKSLN